mmetsp:Transcript_96564/g.278756  ORF Transcript_96564/g.278756 Transcript_96564/m.278756 type:complete len:440 (+) Transcript_96564:67-1386(+)
MAQDGRCFPAPLDLSAVHSPGDGLADVAVDDAPANKWRHPPSFYCPISQQCMHDPVVLADGHSYERQYIKRWLEHHDTSPVSGLKLPQLTMYPNHALRNAIEEYFQQVFSAHRRAIRHSFNSPQSEHGLDSNTPLLRTIDALMQCSLLVNADLSIECVLRRIMDEAKTMVGAEVASVFLLDHERQELYSTVNSTGYVISVPVTNGIAGHVALSGEPIVIHDAYSDARFNQCIDAKTGFRTRNIMCVPLKVKRGRVIGVVQLINKCARSAFLSDVRNTPPDDFTTDDLQFVQVFASQAAIAIGNVQACDDPQLQFDRGCQQPSASVAERIAKSGPSKSETPMSRTPSLQSDCGAKYTAQLLVQTTAEQTADPKEVPHNMEARCRRTPRRTADRDERRKVAGPAEEVAKFQELLPTKKRSGRARQRAAKYWASVRVRTPSP